MNLRDKLKERLDQPAIAVEIEEWGETIYFKPLTCGDINKIQKKYPDFLTSMSGEGMVELILLKSLDKDGEKAFTLEDKPLLLREKMSVIAGIAGAILGSQFSEDHEKN